MSSKIIREPGSIYAALENKAILKQGPVFIEKDGRPEAVLLDIDQYRKLVRRQEFAKRTEEMLAPLQPEIEAYQQMLPELLKSHPGKWVAIHNGKALEISDDPAEMSHRLMQQGIYPLYIEKIQPEPRVFALPSIKIVSRD